MRIPRGDAQHLRHLLPNRLVDDDGKEHDFDEGSFWSSPEAFARWLESQKRSDAFDDTGWNEGDPQWSGSKDMATTLQMARQGWPEGAERVSRVRDYVNAQNPIRKEPIRYAMAGTTPCVPRAVAGDPKSMRAPIESASKRRPIITLIHNMGAYSYVTVEQINNRSAAVAAIIDQIEAAGFCVEVMAISPATCYEGNGKYFRYVTSVLVKPSDQPTDIGRLAFGLGQASMFRRMAFADRGFCKPMTGMGSTIQLKPDNEMRWKNIYLLPSNNVHPELFKDETVTSTVGVKFLINELRKQTCPAFPKWDEADEIKEEDDEEDPILGSLRQTMASLTNRPRKKARTRVNGVR